MTPTPPKIYVTDHQHSKVVSQAISLGCKGQMVPPNRLLNGPAIVYGILRGCDKIIRECQWVGRDFYHIDHGYFRRGHYEGYYRITKNAFQWLEEEDAPPDRWKELQIEMKPWKNGANIVVIPITGAVGTFLGIDPDKWLDATIREISNYTDRQIIVKPKDGTPLRHALMNAHCLVTHSSNAAVDAVLEGVPVVTLGESACKRVSTPLEEIEIPRCPDRMAWACDLSYRQFTLEEFRRGLPWDLL